MSSGQLWVGTSWKMNKTLAEAAAFIDELLAFPIPDGIQAFVLPAHTALAHVRNRLAADSPILLGAQNAHWGPEGAGTGEISMRMAQDAGASLVEMGHSERRQHFAETDATVAAKAAAAVARGLTPLICVGESAAVRDAEGTEAFIAAQLQQALSRLTPAQVERVIIAYEPIWAIGEHGTPATPEQVVPVMALINELLTALTSGGSARAVLYGGGVDAGNAAALLGNPNTDGLFVGRAGWAASGFVELLRLCAPFAEGQATSGPRP